MSDKSSISNNKETNTKPGNAEAVKAIMKSYNEHDRPPMLNLPPAIKSIIDSTLNSITKGFATKEAIKDVKRDLTNENYRTLSTIGQELMEKINSRELGPEERRGVPGVESFTVTRDNKLKVKFASEGDIGPGEEILFQLSNDGTTLYAKDSKELETLKLVLESKNIDEAAAAANRGILDDDIKIESFTFKINGQELTAKVDVTDRLLRKAEEHYYQESKETEKFYDQLRHGIKE